MLTINQKSMYKVWFLKAAMESNLFIASKRSTIFQKHVVIGFFLFLDAFLQKRGALLLQVVETLQPWNNNNLWPHDISQTIAIWNYWPTILHSQVSTLESPEIDDELCIDPGSCEEYINKELNWELHPILHNKSYAQDFCQGHTLNGCYAKLTSNLHAKVGLFILSDPRQHYKFIFPIFKISTALHL